MGVSGGTVAAARGAARADFVAKQRKNVASSLEVALSIKTKPSMIDTRLQILTPLLRSYAAKLLEGNSLLM